MESNGRREILKGLLTGLAGLAAVGAWAKAAAGFGAADRDDGDRSSDRQPAPSAGRGESRVVRARFSVKRHGR